MVKSTRVAASTASRRAALATLMDGETTLADPHAQLTAADWPLLQARHSAPETARYVLADGRRTPDFAPCLGSLESPELGATLLIEVDRVDDGPLRLDLAGPGVAGTRTMRIAGLHAAWLEQRATWNAGFPMGVDVVLADAARLVALPRTTRITRATGES